MKRPDQHYDTVPWEDYADFLEEIIAKMRERIEVLAEGERDEFSNGADWREAKWLDDLLQDL